MKTDEQLIWEAYSGGGKIPLTVFKNNILGAFRIVFDLDKDDTGYDNTFYRPLSSTMGLGSLGIDYDYRVHVKANNTISCHFAFNYKLKKYIIDMMIYEWYKSPPSETEMKDVGRGHNLKGIRPVQKNPIDMIHNVFTVWGDVREVVAQDDEEHVGFIHGENYWNHYMIPQNNILKLAQRVKVVIDGEDRSDDEEWEPTPTPSSVNQTPVYA